MKRWWRRVVLYWNCPWPFYNRVDICIEIAFMTIWSLMGLYPKEQP